MVCHVMAGFQKKDPCFVPGSTLELILPMEELLPFLLPKCETWIEEMESMFGDSSAAARNFLKDLLIFVAQVDVQDGMHLSLIHI